MGKDFKSRSSRPRILRAVSASRGADLSAVDAILAQTSPGEASGESSPEAGPYLVGGAAELPIISRLSGSDMDGASSGPPTPGLPPQLDWRSRRMRCPVIPLKISLRAISGSGVRRMRAKISLLTRFSPKEHPFLRAGSLSFCAARVDTGPPITLDISAISSAAKSIARASLLETLPPGMKFISLSIRDWREWPKSSKRNGGVWPFLRPQTRPGKYTLATGREWSRSP